MYPATFCCTDIGSGPNCHANSVTCINILQIACTHGHALCIVCMSVTVSRNEVLLCAPLEIKLKQAHGVHVQGAARKSYTSKTEIKKDALKKAMRMNQLG